MPAVRGWLFVNERSATFVSEHPLGLWSDDVPWLALTNSEMLQAFIQEFEPKQKEVWANHSRLYIDSMETTLVDWFRHRIAAPKPSTDSV